MPSDFNLFDDKILTLFAPRLEQLTYTLDNVETINRDGMKWSVNYIFISREKSLRIEISQAPYYTEYGFSFFIYNQSNEEFNILCNVPHENHDKDMAFLDNVYEELFSNSETIEIINGIKWVILGRIPIRK